jgi:hypothetical protein
MSFKCFSNIDGWVSHFSPLWSMKNKREIMSNQTIDFNLTSVLLLFGLLRVCCPPCVGLSIIKSRENGEFKTIDFGWDCILCVCNNEGRQRKRQKKEKKIQQKSTLQPIVAFYISAFSKLKKK